MISDQVQHIIPYKVRALLMAMAILSAFDRFSFHSHSSGN